MLKELVNSKIIPVASVLVGSVFLASCSSSVSRFDFPMFGLSSSDDQGASTSSLPVGSRLGQGADDLSGYAGGSGLSGFDNDANPNVVDGGSTNYNSRNSYLPPQIAAPEVRSARYGAVERAPLASAGQRNGGPNYGEGRPSSQIMRNGKTNAGFDNRPMKPIVEARRSFLPAEPSGYNYNGRKSKEMRPVARTAPQRPAPTKPLQNMTADAPGVQSVSVAAGDTLYSIGRRYNVSVVKLMDHNELSDSNLVVGQQLRIPGKGTASIARRAPVATRQIVRATKSGSYTVRPGENFQAIATRFGVGTSELADINGITDPGSIRAGEVLILPASAGGRRKNVKNVQKTAMAKTRGPKDLQVRSVKTRSINLGSAKSETTVLPKQQASVVIRKSPRKKSGKFAFRWPVRGRIIGKFGPRGDGTHNDGINLAVPNGTKVKAAEAGVVAYAGSELKGYGNLVLIRHANDWVSAYAHNDRLMIKRGDKIKRGQVIARAGTSGSVELPQVHFELRKGSKPVDPTQFMAGT